MGAKDYPIPNNVPTLTDIVSPGHSHAPPPQSYALDLEGDADMQDPDLPESLLGETPAEPEEAPDKAPQDEVQTAAAEYNTTDVELDDVDVDVDALLQAIQKRLPVLVGSVLQRHLAMAKEEIVEQVLAELHTRLLDDD